MSDFEIMDIELQDLTYTAEFWVLLSLFLRPGSPFWRKRVYNLLLFFTL